MMRAWFETFALTAFDDFVRAIELLPNIRARGVIIDLNPMGAILRRRALDPSHEGLGLGANSRFISSNTSALS